MAEISTLPIWKANATAEERFLELAMLAREKPERFVRFVVCYEQDTETGVINRQAYSDKVTTSQALGILEAGKLETYLYASGLKR